MGLKSIVDSPILTILIQKERVHCSQPIPALKVSVHQSSYKVPHIRAIAILSPPPTCASASQTSDLPDHLHASTGRDPSPDCTPYTNFSLLRITNNDDDDDDDDETDDILVPPFAASERHSTLLPATFNLVATIVGGGVLSLPLAFSKCSSGSSSTSNTTSTNSSLPGLLAVTLCLLAAVATDRSLYMLCRAARWCGGATYGEVARCAFGKPAEWCVSGLLAVFLLFVITGYMVLIRDIWTPLVSRVSLWRGRQVDGNLVLLGAIMGLGPFLVQKDLHALRYNCYAGFASISILCAALWYRALFRYDEDTDVHEDAVLITAGLNHTATETVNEPHFASFADILFAFPIIILSFLSQFNILPIQAALVQPTRARIQKVTRRAVMASGLLMYLFGQGGYLCFGDKVQGNILLNLKNDQHWMVLAGRVGCGITILFAAPMMLLPCRRNILELLDCYLEYKHQDRMQQQNTIIPQYAATAPSEHSRLISPSTPTSPGRSRSMEVRVHVSENPTAHYLSTFSIALVCYIAAVAAPGVAVVWSLCGCSMAFAIAFILPAACLLQIQRKYDANVGTSSRSIYWQVGSSVMLVLATLSAIVCTFQTTYLLVDEFQAKK